MANGVINLGNNGTTSGGGYLVGTLYWAETVHEAENTSTVHTALYVRKASTTGTITTPTTGYWNWTLNIAGQIENGTAYLSIGASDVFVAEKYVTVAHNSDGSGSAYLSGWARAPSGTVYAGREVFGDATVALTAIARASSLSAGDITLGSALSMTVSAANAAFRHDVLMHLGDTIVTLLSDKKGGTYSAVPPIADFAPILPNSTSSEMGALYIDTYNADRSSKLGRKSYQKTVYIPSSVVPVISSFSVSLQNSNAVIAGWGVAVRGYTKLAYDAEADGAYGSTVKTTTYTPAAGAALSTAGSITPKVTVTDSRGRSASKTAAAITVYDHAAPVLSGASAVRCLANGTPDADGEYVKLSLKAACSSVGGRNAVTLRYRKRTSGGTWSGYTAFTTGAVISGFSASSSYEVELSAIDSIGSSKAIAIPVPTASVAFHIREGGQGAAFGKMAEQDDLLDVAWDLRVRGAISSDDAAETRANLGITPANIGALAANGSVGVANATTDCNTFYTGISIMGGNVANLPTADWHLIVAGGDAGTNIQIATHLWTGKRYVRYCAAGTWGSWIRSLPVESGGTGATTAAAARTNLGITPSNIGAVAKSELFRGDKRSNFNFNSTTAAGWYWIDLSASSNGPSSSGYGYLEVIKATESSGDVLQRFTFYDTLKTCVRTNVNGWKAWTYLN